MGDSLIPCSAQIGIQRKKGLLLLARLAKEVKPIVDAAGVDGTGAV